MILFETSLTKYGQSCKSWLSQKGPNEIVGAFSKKKEVQRPICKQERHTDLKVKQQLQLQDKIELNTHHNQINT